MANLKDLLVNGPSNLIGDVTVNKIRLTSLEVNNGTTYDPGSNGQVLKSNGTSVYWANDNNTTSFTITANATDGLWDLTGTNGTNSVTYALAPYSSKQTTASFYTGTTAPSLSTRLNYDGYLYAKKLYSDGAETITKNGGIINNSLTLQKSSTSPDSPELIFNGQAGNSDAYKWSIQKNSSGNLIFSKISSNNTSTTTIVFSADGYLLPNITDTYDLGSSSQKWRNIYGNLKGNADTATKAGGITSPGTTTQFWRGDNTWSNILKINSDNVLWTQENANNLKLGTGLKTLHIATGENGNDGNAIYQGISAGLTFGIEDKAYAGIYYQSSNTYGSRLYFATTESLFNGAYARMIITNDGKVGIGIANPQELLQINGNICANNIYPKNSNNNNYSSYDLGKTDARWNKLYVNEFAPDEEYSAINIQFSNVWQDLKDSSNNLIHLSKSGTYIVQIYDDSHNDGASGHWRTYWSGIFSWYADYVNGSGEYTEIPLHGVGHAMNKKSIQLRTCSPLSSMMKFQIKGNLSTSANTANNTISIKFKFIM